ncbi:hypothetical protein [Streptomyces sp. NBC_00648]|uniref:TolB family protein n=1 Tax=Streptomyces sp. NBC_00648 TaxID=2975797 RepID=UPI00324BC7B0
MRRRLIAAALLAGAVSAACGTDKEPPGPPEPSARRTVRGDGAELLHRAGGRASAQNPAYSPDGKSLLFTVFHDGYNDGDASLRVLPLDGGPAPWPRTLLADEGQAAVNLPGSSWRASAGVAFASDRAGRDEIWVLKPGGQPVRVTAHTGGSGYIEPSFSPRGDWIVFEESEESKEGADALGSLWKVRPDGSGLVRLLDGPATRTDNRQPNWSPRGDRLVFQRRARGVDSWALYVMNADGTGVRRLTKGAGEHTDASWSPDGAHVVFSSTAGGLDLPKIFVIPAGGGRPLRVTSERDTYDGAPSWSPDGRWIAFESHTGDEDRPTSLWRVPAPRR